MGADYAETAMRVLPPESDLTVYLAMGLLGIIGLVILEIIP